MNRLNKTESAVFLYCRFSLVLKDPFSQIISGWSQTWDTLRYLICKDTMELTWPQSYKYRWRHNDACFASSNVAIYTGMVHFCYIIDLTDAQQYLVFCIIDEVDFN